MGFLGANAHTNASERSDDSVQCDVRSEVLLEFVSGDLAIPEDLCEQTAPDGFSAVHGNDRGTSIGVAKETMAAL